MTQSFLTRLHSKLRRAWAKGLGRCVGYLGGYPSDMFLTRTYRFNGVRLRIRFDNDYERSRWDRVASGVKEPETLRWIDQEFTSSEVFADIGANVGNYSLYAAVKHPGLRVFAFEPEPNSLTQLVRNAQLNDLAVTCFALPLCEKTGLDFFNINCAFVAGESNHQFGRVIDSSGQEFRPVVRIGIMGCSLDHLIQKGIMPPPNHVKIDVDGLEEQVLGGMRHLLCSPHLRTVLCEITGSSEKVSRIEGLFRENGFFRVHSPLGSRIEGNFIYKRRVITVENTGKASNRSEVGGVHLAGL